MMMIVIQSEFLVLVVYVEGRRVVVVKRTQYVLILKTI